MSELTAPTSGSPLSPALRGRLDAHRNELRRLHDALAQRPHPEERAILAGALLGASGYLIRRSRALTAEGRGDLVTVDAALKSLAREDIAAWLARASTAGLRQALQRAADAAFEVALSDDDEREGHKEAALEGLAERETLAATLTALRRWEEQNSPLEDRSARRRDALEAEAKNADDALRKAAFALTPLNPERRAERDLLDGAHQHEAWWYALQADNDEAVALMTGSPTHTSFLHDQPQVSQAIQLAQSPPQRHLSEEELWAYDLGAMNKDQRSWVSRHAASCPDCKRALRALSEGEDAINEALGAAPLRSQPAAVEPDQEIAFEHQHFRALVFRSAKKIRLVIEEKTPGALRAVSPSLKPRRLRGGFEVQLRPAARTEPATSRLTVTLAAGDDVGFDVALRLPQARCARRGRPHPSPLSARRRRGRGEARERQPCSLANSTVSGLPAPAAWANARAKPQFRAGRCVASAALAGVGCPRMTGPKIGVALAILLGFAAIGCENDRPLTAANVKKIQVCHDRKVDVRERFGPPDEIGIVGGLTSWSYRSFWENNRIKLLLVFNDRGVVVDMAFNPPGLVSLENRCK